MDAKIVNNQKQHPSCPADPGVGTDTGCRNCTEVVLKLRERALV